MSASLALVRWWMQGARCRSRARLDGKLVVITGANTGIGRSTALELSRRGAGLVLLCRDVGRGEEAAGEIRRETGGEVVVHRLDLSSLKSVRECAEHLNNTLEKVDILINNAGVMVCPEMRTEEGFEMQIGTNHFGHFLLTNLLLPLIKAAAPGARIVTVSSRAHERGRIQWEDIHWQRTPYSALDAYSQSKLANLLFSAELARRLEHSGVTVYSLHPGVIATDLFRHAGDSLGPAAGLLLTLGKPLLRTVDSGAQTSVYCAVDPSIAGHSGRYYSDCGEVAPGPQAEDMDHAKLLWEMSERLTGLEQSPKSECVL